MDLGASRDALREFADERDWAQFHTPKNLLLALVGEVGELAEQMQWRTDKEIRQEIADAPDLIALEIADIAIYLIRLADVLGVDLGEAIDRKIAVNRQRFPPAL
jgi:dCTP diphosphatase